MSLNRTARKLFCAAVLATSILQSGTAQADGTSDNASVADGRNWPFKGGNALGQHFSTLANVNTKNVSELGLAWVTDLPEHDGIAGTPIVVDGVVYVSGAFSVVYAIDAASGEILWRYDPGLRGSFGRWPGLYWTALASRGVAVWGTAVYLTTADCQLIALNADTGMPRWSRETCDPDKGYGISDSPYVGDDKVFVGNKGSESGEKVRGYVSAYSAEHGELLWRFYTVPSDDPAENTTPAMKMAAATWSGDALARYGGGGSAWNEMTYDPETGLLFFGTAGALPYVHSIRSPDGGDNLFLSSVIALDANSGEYAWHYQTVPADSWDYNATMNITLAEFEIGGKVRKTLLIAPKNGFHYVLDRVTGQLLAADKYAMVNWASHVNLESGRPVYLPDAKYWASDAAPVVAVWPNMWGAHNWNPMAWHPGLRLSYIPVIDMPTIVTNYSDGEFDDTLEIVRQVDGRALAPGKLVAFDPLAGKPRWTIDQELPLNGGVMATAGNLVFQGDAQGRFTAYAADSGEILWSVTTGSAISSAPATYVSGGEQYIVIPVGPAGGLQYSFPRFAAAEDALGPTRVFAFRLHGDVQMPAANVAPHELPTQPVIAANAETIAAGKRIYAKACSYCHGTNVVARFGGSVPDLRYTSPDTHTAWHAIVIGGSRRANGMPPFDITIEQSEAVRAYVVSKATSPTSSQTR